MLIFFPSFFFLREQSLARQGTLQLLQALVEKHMPAIKATKGFKSLQRVICGGCHDFKVGRRECLWITFFFFFPPPFFLLFSSAISIPAAYHGPDPTEATCVNIYLCLFPLRLSSPSKSQALATLKRPNSVLKRRSSLKLVRLKVLNGLKHSLSPSWNFKVTFKYK